MNKRRIIQRQQQKMGQQKERPSMAWPLIAAMILVPVIIAGLVLWLSRPGALAPQNLAPEKVAYEYPEKVGTTIGEQSAPIFILVFSDFQCSFCKQFSEVIQPRIINEYVATGKVRMEYRHFVVVDSNTGTDESNRAAQASECAGEQGRFWPYHDLLYARQQGEASGAFSDENLRGFAAELGLDAERFDTCLSSNRYANKIQVDKLFAQQQNIGGTPAVFVGGKLVANPTDWETVQTAIETALEANQK